MSNSKAFFELHQRACTELENSIPDSLANLSEEQITQMVYELRVHQVELQMQNEELMNTQQSLTESKQALQDSHQRFYQLYHRAPVGYITLDSKGMILQTNQRFAQMCGLSVAHLEQTPFISQVLADDHKVFRARFKSLFKKPQNKEIELTLNCFPHGHYKALIETGVTDLAEPCPDGSTQELFITITDITHLKEIEEQMLLAKEVAEHANMAKSEFLSRMSHELRTPMNAIMGFGQLLQLDNKNFNDMQKASIGHILDGGKILLNLINEVLDISAIDAGEMKLMIEQLPLEDILTNMLVLINPLAVDANVTIDPIAGQEYSILADEQRVKQVIVNLLSNAVKYNVKGGKVTISYKATHDHTGRPMVRISVTDTGIGIRTEHQSKVFEPFARIVHEGEEIEGTGIGLTIAKKMVELMSGQLNFNSVWGHGSTFWFELPRATNEQTITAPEAKIQLPTHFGKTTEFKTVLYIEDHHINRQLMNTIFEQKSNYLLITANNAEQGINDARLQQPDLILMDIDLPDMNGFEALEVLKRDLKTVDIPVIAVSALAMREDIEKAEKANFETYLTKPVDFEKLFSVLASTLSPDAQEHRPV